MPVIPAPHEHLKAALDAIDEHRLHHEARITFHRNEVKALYTLREQYETVLSEALDHAHIEPSTEVAAITVVGATSDNPQPTFDELVATMSGRIPQP